MKFAAILVSCVALITGAIAQNAAEIINSLQEGATASVSLQQMISSMTTDDAVSIASTIEGGLNIIMQDITRIAIPSMNGVEAPFDDTDSAEISAAFGQFVQVGQELLNTVIEKQSVISATGSTSPIESALQSLQGAVDNLVAQLIPLLSTTAADVSSDKAQLDTAFNQAIADYAPGEAESST